MESSSIPASLPLRPSRAVPEGGQNSPPGTAIASPMDMMTEPLTLIAAILALAAIYVVPLVVTEVYLIYRGRKYVECPDSELTAVVELQAGRAAASAILGLPRVRLKTCSRWPEHGKCDGGCLRPI